MEAMIVIALLFNFPSFVFFRDTLVPERDHVLSCWKRSSQRALLPSVHDRTAAACIAEAFTICTYFLLSRADEIEG